MLKPELEKFDYAIDGIDDEIDCAILNDENFRDALADIDTTQPTAEEELEDDEDIDLTDTSLDYDGSIPGTGIEDMDADDYIAAERDIARNPFEEDELIDSAIGEDPEIEDLGDDDFEEDI